MKDNFIPPGPLRTPVLFMIFNRPDTTQKVFTAIKRVKPRQLFVAADGPREDKEGEKEKCEQVRKIIEQVDWDCEVKILFRDKNLGCKIAVSSAIDWFFENVEEGIILEDDCLPSQSFFWYCQELLGKYKNNMKVWLISGFNILRRYKKSPYSYEFTTAGSIWGWATWKRAWNFYDVEMKLWKNLEAVEKWKKFLNDKEEIEMGTKVYELTYNGKINSWAYTWGFIRRVYSGLAITPVQNFILNIGMNENATHTKKSNNTFRKMEQYNVSFPLKHPNKIEPNRKFSRRIFKKASNPPNIIKNFIIKTPILYNLLRSFKKKKTIITREIDFVITWVDWSDPKWQSDFKKYNRKNYSKEVSGKHRYRDFGNLKYIFRGFEQLTPWVRKIHFVTYGHIPEWMNVNHPKIHIVKHEDIFPDNSVLPVFNSAAIEMCLHNIPGLSEKFIYFNDDSFIIKPVKSNRFFYKDLPRDFFILSILFHNGRFSHNMHSNMALINKEITNKYSFFCKNITKILNWRYGIKNILKNILLLKIGQLSLFKLYHHPQPFSKNIFLEVEKLYKDEIEKTRKQKFRNCEDINQYIFRFWGLIKGRFAPYMPKDAFYCGISNSRDVENGINILKNNPKISFVCFNEDNEFSEEEFQKAKQYLKDYFHSIFPNKSNFEK